jgi:hypothetical protein
MSTQLDPERTREMLARIYFALDGQWFLKVRDRFGEDEARDLNEAMCGSLARIQVRSYRDLTGDNGTDARALGRFVRVIHDVLYGDHRDAFEVKVDAPDEFTLRYHRCQIWEMGQRAGYDADPQPGLLPGCAGILTMASAWGAAVGGHVLERAPGLDEGRVACLYSWRPAVVL